MRFGDVPLAQAEGAILAHSQAVGDGQLRKGMVLGAAEIEALRDAGHDRVTVARLDPADCDENAAARLLGAAITGARDCGLRAGAAGTGRVNIYATGPGVLSLDVERIEAANRINPMITLATLPPHSPLSEGRMVATVKIISYGVALDDARRAAALLEGALLRAAPRLRRAGLIVTEMRPGAEPSRLTVKGRAAVEARLSALGVALTECRLTAHASAPIARALSDMGGELALILTASATSDPADVAPEAVRLAGGRVDRFGMPVDPGNLLFLGEQGGRPVIGLPGCVRAPTLNGADWVLERIVCGIEVGDAQIAQMGVGGLLKEGPQRPHPRERRT
ncbi:molybdopterin-binding protein [Profundibacterium mesophilum]|uniref:Formylmethanofuran dehydrogenase subunit E n=1 Tax=Profundibacterium mesophilum KAUST100406-0324 TaxID=1037889 RepID=A0A921TE06_9RHOB|nr:molybdopterin-binding protein [Profundibacterium mesophilum]KAF0676797.1 formylmethanofuran dehydrogenase subunit E [Profundibacterium mesophilum KAUST100406-0324]